MTENIATRIYRPIVVSLPNGKRNDCSQHKSDIGIDASRLDLGHNATEERCEKPVADHTSNVCAVYDRARS